MDRFYWIELGLNFSFVWICFSSLVDLVVKLRWYLVDEFFESFKWGNELKCILVNCLDFEDIIISK